MSDRRLFLFLFATVDPVVRSNDRPLLQVGFLSLLEHYQYTVVGNNYKNPLYPVWVLCSESHFTVLFSRDASVVSTVSVPKKFDVCYYDELANQDHLYVLTVDTGAPAAGPQSLESPVECCIRTKFRGAVIDWNGDDVLL